MELTWSEVSRERRRGRGRIDKGTSIGRRRCEIKKDGQAVSVDNIYHS